MSRVPRPRPALAAWTATLSVTGVLAAAVAVGALSPPAKAPVRGTTTTTRPATTTTTTVPPNPRQVFAEAIAAVRTETAVHWVSRVRSGAYSISLVTNAGMVDGVQTMTVTSGGQTGHVTAILMGPVAYVMGDEVGLRAALYFNPTAASQEAGRWVALASAASSPQSERQLYSAVSAGLTMPSVIAAMDLPGTLSLLPPGKVDGRPAVGVRVSVPQPTGTSASGATPGATGTPSGPAISQELLFVRTSGLPLPEKVVFTAPHVTSTAFFGPWGRAPAAQVPPGAVPFDGAWQ